METPRRAAEKSFSPPFPAALKTQRRVNTGTKLILAGIAAAGIYLALKAKEAAENFTFEVIGYGTPKLSKSVLTLPIKIQFSNPFPVDVPVQRFEADIFIAKQNEWKQIGHIVEQNLTIASGVSERIISPQIDIIALFGDFLEYLKQLAITQSVQIRTDVRVTAAGVMVTPEPFVQSITLPQSLPV